jgi:hypothetical protein
VRNCRRGRCLKARLTPILPLAAMVMLLPRGSFAADARLAADAFTSIASPTKNFGTASALVVSGAGTIRNEISYLRFDFPSLGTAGK